MTVRAWVFGSAADCDVRILDDEYVSGRHAQVTLRAFAEDLGSTNGTRIKRANGIVVPVRGPVPLQPGDTLVIGRTLVPWERP
jgi:pSer/pThr/pTyr-binding forkhead associated (FHA) protein